MVKEILLYESIYSYSAERFILLMDEAIESDIVVRVNSPGGDPLSAFGMLSKMKEHKKNVNLKVDGAAYSMAAFMACYADNVECLDVSEFMFHRASYGRMGELQMSENDISNLNRTNKYLREALEAKVDVAKFEEITKTTMDQLFSLDSRIDVYLDSKEAKEIGLVDNIISIQPTEMAALNSKYFKMAAEQIDEKPKEEKTIIPKKMNKETLKSEHPELFASIQTEAITAEQDRAGAWLAFAEADLEAVKAGIESGKNITQKMTAEMTIKLISAEKVKGAESDSAGDLDTDASESAKDEETKKMEALNSFEAEVKTNYKKV